MTTVIQATGMLNALVGSVRSQVPHGIMRDYWVWALSDQNPYQARWIQTIGIPQFERLTAALLDGVVEERHAGLLDALAAMMNVYLLYETLSDNLAIGCARLSEYDADIMTQKDVLCQFNNAMIEKLTYPHTDVQAMLSPIQDKMQSLSLFEHSLSKGKQQKLAHVFTQQHATASVEDIEYGGWAMLIANIEAASATLSLVNNPTSYAFVQGNLVRRYDAVNQLLHTDSHEHTFDDLLNIGTSTILVPAVLAFYYAVIAELKGHAHFKDVVESGTAQAVLDDAALLIRLLNDVGPALVLDADKTESIITVAHELSEQSTHKTSVFDLLTQLVNQFPEMTRIKKDLDFSEYNILLDALDDDAQPVAVLQIEYSLRTYYKLYTSLTKRLHERVAELDAQLGDDSYGKIALRFVHFHEKLYMNDYQLNKGEYAV